jgi:iron(III) transport system permease protein
MYLYLIIPIPIYGTLWVIVIANVIIWMPFASRAIMASLFQIHKELEEAAQTSGASWKNVYLKITLPLIIPAFLNGWLWVAIHAVRELAAALMLFSPDSIVLSTIIWNFWDNGRIGETCVLGVILIILLSMLTIIGRLVTSWRSRMY